jgi:hypothetical protein
MNALAAVIWSASARFSFQHLLRFDRVTVDQAQLDFRVRLRQRGGRLGHDCAQRRRVGGQPDSNLRSRLRRGLLCTPVTGGNEVPHIMIGAYRGQRAGPGLPGTLSAGHAGKRGGASVGLPCQRLLRVVSRQARRDMCDRHASKLGGG